MELQIYMAIDQMWHKNLIYLNCEFLRDSYERRLFTQFFFNTVHAVKGLSIEMNRNQKYKLIKCNV